MILYFTIEDNIHNKPILIFNAPNIDEAINTMYFYMREIKENERKNYTMRLKFKTEDDFEKFKKLNYYICNGNIDYKTENIYQQQIKEVFTK